MEELKQGRIKRTKSWERGYKQRLKKFKTKGKPSKEREIGESPSPPTNTLYLPSKIK